jgi:hypothetical protein
VLTNERKELFLKVLGIFHKCINAKLVGTLVVADVDHEHLRKREDVLEQARQEGRILNEILISTIHMPP